MLRNFRELWQYRNLLWALVCRHLNARYRGSALGFIWSFLNPLCLIAVYSLVFLYYLRFNQVENYSLFLFAGLLPWLWFSTSLLESTSAISGGGALITKAMFPTHILPTVTVLTNLANFLFAIPLLIAFMLIVGVMPSWALLALPLIIALELLFLLGLALALSAVNTYYRDVQHILANLMTLWFFLTPIIYPAENVPARVKFSLLFNPAAIFTEMYHRIFLRGEWPSLALLSIAVVFAVVSLLLGNAIFNHYREDFAELV
jgi:lipopolysaccharide transport system permease protein